MRDEPRRPIFWFLWAQPDPHAPLDDAYRQVRAVRVSPRGPIRLLMLVVLAMGEVIVTGTALIAALSAGISWLAFVGGAVAASGLFLLLRGWVVGTYVTDDAVIIETTFRRVSLPWSDVTDIRTASARAPFLGFPLGVPTTRTAVVAGREHDTHVYATSPDYWLRPEAFDMAVLRLERWRQASPR